MAANSIEYTRKYYKENRGKYLEAQRKYNAKNPEKVKARQRAYRKTDTARYARYKGSAKRRGYEFSLNKEGFSGLIHGVCHYCGSHEKVGVDRVENTTGYTSENCVSCCASCNYFKGTTDYDIFIAKCVAIAEHHKQLY